MTQLPEVITLGPDDEAERLWEGAVKANEKAADNLVALCESIDLGLHAAEILVIQRLIAIKDQFPATIGAQLQVPLAEVDVYRDAVSVPSNLEFTEILDLLSEEGLECVGPRLHRGWEDRRFSCHRARDTARDGVGITLGSEERDQLLLLAAYRNRIFRYPPPLQIVPSEILAAFDSLTKLVEGLLGK
jgi:hypothetical protein